MSVSVNDQSSKLFKSESDIKIKDLPKANAPRFNNFERDNNNLGMQSGEDENNNRLFTTEVDGFPSDARFYEEHTFKSKVSDIADNKDKQKIDSTDEVRKVEANEQTSKWQTTSSQKKSYLIFTLIKYIKKKTPSLIKRISFRNFYENILIFIFMMITGFFNSYTINTLFEIREEFKIRGLIDKSTENSIYHQL